MMQPIAGITMDWAATITMDLLSATAAPPGRGKGCLEDGRFVHQPPG